MKTLILVAVILQLVITIKEINGLYKFGDIIMFPRICPCLPAYKHYAIYVGKSEKNFGQGENDIFHRTGKRKGKLSDCKFDKLQKTEGIWKSHKEDNYLDKITDPAVRTPEGIIERINESIKSCGEYGLLANNCEHLATYVRYGMSLTLQRGTTGGCIFGRSMDRDKFRAIEEKFKEDSSRLEDTDHADCACDNNPDK